MSGVREYETFAEEALDWQPLEDLIGYRLADNFMWMCRMTLENGRHLHLYKHISTRHYLHIATDGRVYVFVPINGYREVEPRWAIAMCFRGWEDLQPEPEDIEFTRTELARLTRLPDDDEDEPILGRKLLRAVIA